jgi:predicted nucleic acid-binding protein
LFFSRYTQLGLLRLLTNRAAMGERTLTIREAWDVYDRWLRDPRVEFHPEPRDVERGFREALTEFSARSAPNWIGDCYLLAYARHSEAALVTFDSALHRLARTQGCAAVIPG